MKARSDLRPALPGSPESPRLRLPGSKSTVSKLSSRIALGDTRRMQMPQNIGAAGATRLTAAALAALGAASAIPIPLAQLDFAGVINVFHIDSGDSPRALLVIAGVGGALTFGVLALALAGAFLAATGATSARAVLIGAALAGLVTAMPLWIPAGVLIAAAAALLGSPKADRFGASQRNLLHVSGRTHQHSTPARSLIHTRHHHWLPFAALTALALGIWVVSAAHGYAWQMLWLPAVIAAAAWPTHRTRIPRCLRSQRNLRR
jgi:hypothetical protein